MIPAEFDYVRATSVRDAVKALASGAKVIAGGHSLLPLMRFRM
jgi:carbon-monoxide dehydrogenase medium subunit